VREPLAPQEASGRRVDRYGRPLSCRLCGALQPPQSTSHSWEQNAARHSVRSCQRLLTTPAARRLLCSRSHVPGDDCNPSWAARVRSREILPLINVTFSFGRLFDGIWSGRELGLSLSREARIIAGHVQHACLKVRLRGMKRQRENTFSKKYTFGNIHIFWLREEDTSKFKLFVTEILKHRSFLSNLL
jgi:hypothetical protein